MELLSRLEERLPDAFKRADRNLLLYEPDVWATRLHGVIAAAVPFYVLFGAAMVALPLSPAMLLYTETFFALSFILPVLSLVYYGYKQQLFRSYQDYGKRGNRFLAPYLQFTLLLFAVGTMTAFPFVFSRVYLAKMNAMVSSTQLARDVNALSLGSPFFSEGGFRIGKTSDGKIHIQPYKTASGATLKSFNQSAYVSFNDKNRNETTSDHLKGALHGERLEERILAPMTKSEAQKRIADYLDVYKRYGYPLKATPEQVLHANLELVAKPNLPGDGLTLPDGAGSDEYAYSRHDVTKFIDANGFYEKENGVRKVLDELQQVKIGGHFLQHPWLPRFFALGTFYLTFLLFIFSRTDPRYFLMGAAFMATVPWAVVAGEVLFVQTFLSNSSRLEEKVIFSTLLIGFFTCLALALRTLILRRYYKLNELAVFSVSVATPFLPVFLMLLIRNFEFRYIHVTEALVWFLLGAGAVLTYLFVPLYQSLYTRLKAIPAK